MAELTPLMYLFFVRIAILGPIIAPFRLTKEDISFEQSLPIVSWSLANHVALLQIKVWHADPKNETIKKTQSKKSIFNVHVCTIYKICSRSVLYVEQRWYIHNYYNLHELQ